MKSELNATLSGMVAGPFSIFRRSLLLLAAVVTAIAPSSVGAGWNAAPETIEQHPTWIYTPANAMPDGKHPLLVALHGCAQTHDQIKDFGNLKKSADDHGIVLAIPSVGNEFFGNVQQKCWDYNGANDAMGHIVELVGLANTLKARTDLNIDANHVYIVGLSSGAAMALAVGCKAPDVFAGIGVIAGPSVGSSQNDALDEASMIPPNNVSSAIRKCQSLAGDKISHFDTQIASIAYGDMDKNGPKAKFPFFLGSTAHPGQFSLVSIKWSEDNIEVLRAIYGSGPLEPEPPVQNGLGTLQVAKKDNMARLSLVVAHDVGHAWPAGTGSPNSVSQGGIWVAQTGLNYPEFVTAWLISNNKWPKGNPEVTVTATVSASALSVTGTATDPDGSIARVDTTLLQADAAGAFQRKDSHNSIPLNPGGNYTDSFSNLLPGWYKARVTATDNANKTAAQISPQIKVGDPPPIASCRDFSDTNFGHVMKGRAVACNFGFTCTKGSGENLGLFNVAVTSIVTEASPGFFRKGACPVQ